MNWMDQIPSSKPISRELCRGVDSNDPLREWKSRFALPDQLVYLDGNSLGALPLGVAERLDQVIKHEWGEELISSWNKAGWFDLPSTTGNKIAKLIGAQPGEVIVADSTSVNLFKVLEAAGRATQATSFVTSENNFPTDVYVGSGVSHSQQAQFRIVSRDQLVQASGANTVVFLSHVDFKSGQIEDMKSLTSELHEAGAVVVWDLAHSVGAVSIQLNEWNVDFAVGCGYKYLNGGPGAPAFLYVSKRWQPRLQSPIQGWFGHQNPFEFSLEYSAHFDIRRFQAGTPPILSLATLDKSLDLWDGICLDQVRAKSVSLGYLFQRLVAQRLSEIELRLESPENPELRGSHITYSCPQGFAMMQALISLAVVGDFRAPDLMRFGFAPLYVSHEDIWIAIDRWHSLIADRSWERPEFQVRANVT